MGDIRPLALGFDLTIMVVADPLGLFYIGKGRYKYARWMQ